MMTVTLGELAELVGGGVRGSKELLIAHALPLESKLPPACLTLVDKAKGLESLHACSAAAAVVPLGFPDATIPLLEVADPHQAFQQIITRLRPTRAFVNAGISPNADVHPTAQIGPGAHIAAGASVGAGCKIGPNVQVYGGAHLMADCVVGADCQFFSGVVLYPNTRIGDRCTFHANCVLGAHGFGYRSNSGRHLPSGQLGWVEIEDDVELGACVTIDRGTYGATRVGAGTKIDNLVMIGHNCRIGRHNLICAQVGIAGSSSTGDHVVLAGQVGIKDHIQIGDRVMLAAQSGVMHDLLDAGVYSGVPAVAAKKHMQSVACISRLPETRSDLKTLQAEVAQLRHQLAALAAAVAPDQATTKTLTTELSSPQQRAA